jgi:hypothetical protein
MLILVEFFFIDTSYSTYQPRFPTASTLSMGKSDEKQTIKRAHKATDGESKYKNKPSFDTLGSSPFEATFEAMDNDGGLRHYKWCEFFRQLCEYKVQFGHCLVLQRYVANPKLGQWVSTQRTRYKLYQEGKPSPMTAEHIRALDGVGFDWGTRKTVLKSTWSERFEQLREFNVQFGHCLVPKRYAANPTLGGWVSKQRTRYKLYQEGKPSPIKAEHIQALDGIGFDWETSKTDSTWSERFRELCEFKAQFGHCLVAQNYPDNLKLGRWVSNQRARCREFQQGKPSPVKAEHIRALDGIGFDWGTRKTELKST